MTPRKTESRRRMPLNLGSGKKVVGRSVRLRSYLLYMPRMLQPFKSFLQACQRNLQRLCKLGRSLGPAPERSEHRVFQVLRRGRRRRWKLGRGSTTLQMGAPAKNPAPMRQCGFPHRLSLGISAGAGEGGYIHTVGLQLCNIGLQRLKVGSRIIDPLAEQHLKVEFAFILLSELKQRLCHVQ